MSIFQQVKEYIKANPHYLGVLFPNAKQKGNELYFDSPSYNSWSYNISKGLVKDFRSSERQDLISVYQRLNGLASPFDSAKEIARQLNIKLPNSKHTKIKHDVTSQESVETKLATRNNIENNASQGNNKSSIDKEKILRVVNAIWKESLPIGKTVAEQYLNKRGIALPFSSTQKGNALRFHPALYHRETGKKHPALIAGIFNGNNLSAIHRHYLDEQGNKLNVKQPKMMLGDVRGLAVKLGKVSDSLSVCEGLESGLALYQEKKQPVWCVLSAGNMPNLILPEGVTKMQIHPDIEPSGTGQKNAYISQSKWAAKGYRVELIFPTVKTKQGKTIDLNKQERPITISDNYIYEERAGIIEYDSVVLGEKGGFTKEEAEKMAREEISKLSFN
jgi:hypothetical protein